MKSFKIFLEARKNPKLNIKRDIYRRLKPYKDMQNIYISMRDINKLGINPMSEYKTVLGIYAYPLWLVWDLIDSTESLRGLPFQGGVDFVYLIKPKFNPIMLGELTRSWVEDFIGKVISKPNYKLFFIDGDVVGAIKEIERDFSELSKLDKAIEKDKEYSTLFDNNMNILVRLTVYMRKKGIQLKDVLDGDTITEKFIEQINLYIKDLTNNLKELKSKANVNLDPKEIYEEGKKRALVNSPGGIFWWITYKIAGHNITKWNAFFREFGINGVVDNKGEGIIHEHEPIQAVFFDKTKIKTLGVFENKEYKEKIETLKQFIIKKMKNKTVTEKDITNDLIANIKLFRLATLDDMLLFLGELKVNPIKKTLKLEELINRIKVSFVNYSNFIEGNNLSETKKIIQDKINEIFEDVEE